MARDGARVVAGSKGEPPRYAIAAFIDPDADAEVAAHPSFGGRATRPRRASPLRMGSTRQRAAARGSVTHPRVFFFLPLTRTRLVRHARQLRHDVLEARELVGREVDFRTYRHERHRLDGVRLLEARVDPRLIVLLDTRLVEVAQSEPQILADFTSCSQRAPVIIVADVVVLEAVLGHGGGLSCPWDGLTGPRRLGLAWAPRRGGAHGRGRGSVQPVGAASSAADGQRARQEPTSLHNPLRGAVGEPRHDTKYRPLRDRRPACSMPLTCLSTLLAPSPGWSGKRGSNGRRQRRSAGSSAAQLPLAWYGSLRPSLR